MKQLSYISFGLILICTVWVFANFFYDLWWAAR